MPRPRGIKETKPRRTAARKVAEAAAAEGITPLELMLRVMRDRWNEGDRDGALIAAEKVAPYVHPKLASTDARVSVTKDAARLTDDELAAIAAGRGEAASGATAGAGELGGVVH